MLLVKMPSQRELWGISAIILIGAFLVPPGFFTVDESIYHLGARAIVEWGTLGFDNGFDQFRSESLKLKLLVDGPQGLTPQYPAGSSLLAAPLIPLLGPRAFIVLDAIAGVATLFTVRKICLLQFGSEAIARIAVGLLAAGTFWLAYALSIWPHALAAFCAVQAYWFALRHLKSEEQGYRSAVLAGLFAGAGMLFRLDAILAVPAIGLMLALFAPSVIRSAAWFGAGTLPSFAAMSVLNSFKFGSPNPLSYGRTGGNTDVASYGAVLAALCLGFVLIVLFRKAQWKVSRTKGIASIAAVGGLLFLIPATSPSVLQFLKGFAALVADMRLVEESRQFLQHGPGETLRFYGLTKKALGQSLPWIGLAAALLTCQIHQGERRAVATLSIFIASFTAPFIWLSWHGGGGGDMRYFLPALPVLSILCAKLLNDFWKAIPDPRRWLLAGLAGSLALIVAWTKSHPSGFEGVQQIVSTYVLLATALSAIAAGIDSSIRRVAAGLTIALVTAGVCMAFLFASFDLAVTLKARATSAGVNKTLATLPPKSLVISRPEWVAVHLPGNGSIAADSDTLPEGIDAELVGKALDAGYRVFMVEYDAKLSVPPEFDFSETPYAFPRGRAIELKRRASQRDNPDERALRTVGAAVI